MQKIYTLVCTVLVSCMVCLSTSAQTRQQLSLGVGGLSDPVFVTAKVWKNRGLVGVGGTEVKSTGSWQLGYSRAVGKYTDLGFQFVAEHQKVIKTGGSSSPENMERYRESRDKHYSLIVDVKQQWGGKSLTKWYSGAGVGLGVHKRREIHNDFSTIKEEFTKAKPAWQVTAIGLSVGKKLRGYAELGYGYRGVLTGGLSWGL